MKLTHLLASTALLATLGAQAQVVGTLGGGTSNFASLSASGLDGGALATLSGGAVLAATDPSLTGGVMPASAANGNVLVASPAYSSVATLAFTGAGQDQVGFLWGSPDYYNQLTVTTTGGVQTTFDAAMLGLATDGSNLQTPQYVQFTAAPGSMITALTFNDSPDYAGFEVANFSVAAVPEPETYALLMGGLAIVGFVARRRRA